MRRDEHTMQEEANGGSVESKDGVKFSVFKDHLAAITAEREARAEAEKAADAERRAVYDNLGQDVTKRRSLTYAARVTLAFVLISAMTTLLAFGVLSYVWEQHFQTYTRENMQRIADTTAASISARYQDGQQWYGGALAPASTVHDMNNGVGVQVIDTSGNVLYDDTNTMEADGISLAPQERESLATSFILDENGQIVGTVKVWVYGSNALLTQADQEFKDKSYQAMVFSALLAVAIALFVGIMFARNLVDPINRISRAAQAFGQGDLSARTNLEGYDEIARLGMTFDTMAESVEKDRKLERRLTTDVAHELRTPLMAIQSTVEAIMDGVFEADEERLDTIDSEVKRLSRLVDAILKLSRLENRAIPLHEEIVNVGDLISGLISTHEAYVHESGLELYYQADPFVYVYADPDLIRQAIANLISNAVRYTPEGSITVSVKQGELMASISVADTGIGLSEEEAKMVFSRFWRADAGRNREQGGLGVGLSVVKEIVDQHGGWVRVEGEPNVGATFTIFIPLYDEERVRQQRAKARRQRGGDSSEDAQKGKTGPMSRWRNSHETRRKSDDIQEDW